MTDQTSRDDQFLQLIRRIIEKNIDNENFSVEELAEKGGLSRSMLHRKLVKLTGKSATDYIMEIRLNRAMELLEKDVATVSEIAYKVGFNSTSYFHRAFKKRFKVSPGGIKKNITRDLYQKQDEKNLSSKVLNKSKYVRLGIPSLLILLAIIIAGGLVYSFIHKQKAPEKSIAILPFDNLSPDEENRYFADGIVEDLLNRLSGIEDLKVISRTSSEVFREKGNKTIPEIAEILAVKYILEGSVQRETDQVRISIQLIDAEKDDHILSEQYDRDLSEVFKIQGDIASQIVDELSVILSDQQQKEIWKIPTHSLKALDYYQIGRFNYCYCTDESVEESTYYLKKAVEADSTFALPYANLALTYRYLAHTGYFPDIKTGRDSAEIMAYKALKLDRNLAEAHVALGFIYFVEDLDLKRAKMEYQKALALNPNSSEACKKYAEYLNLTGKTEKAREYINKAIRLDPLDISTRISSTWMYIQALDLEAALEENKKSLEVVRDHPDALNLSFYIYHWLGDEEAAYERARYYDQKLGKYPPKEVDSAYAREGTNGIIRLYISRSTNYFEKAHLYLHLGEVENAMEILESAHNHGELDRMGLYNFLKRADIDLKSNPRFYKLLEEFGIEDY